MKNQNDLIFSIVAIVVFLIAFFVCYGTKPEPVKPASPAPVVLAEPALPTGVTPVLANELPGGGSGGGSGLGSPSGAGAGRSVTGAPAGSGKAGGLPQLSVGMSAGAGGK
jgi:hypothetical protein